MSENVEILEQKLDQLLGKGEQPLIQAWDFWLFLVLSLIGIGLSAFGLWYSIRSFKEAQAAREAAVEAGRTVKVQTVTIELSEIMQRLDALETDISFTDVRNLHTEISRRLRRLTASLKNDADTDLESTIDKLLISLEETRTALDEILPEQSPRAENVVYNAMEGHFSRMSGCVATLMGLLEKRTIDVGDGQK